MSCSATLSKKILLNHTTKEISFYPVKRGQEKEHKSVASGGEEHEGKNGRR
jgi:hypothetical protein